jgi:type III secretory pathway lipoprotein EscJ
LSETDPISRKVKPASASIMIKYKAGMDVDTLIPKIKQLVSYGVEELPYQNVSVMLSEELGQKDDMIAQVLQKPQSNAGGQMMTGNDAMAMQDDTEKTPNMLFLYVLMGIIAVGMTIIIFLILHFKNQQFNNKFANPNNPENLPMEF